MDQFVELDDKKSTVHGSNVRVQYYCGTQSDSKNLEANKGKIITKKGPMNNAFKILIATFLISALVLTYLIINPILIYSGGIVGAINNQNYNVGDTVEVFEAWRS